jgi:hypothetical protein
MKKLTVILSALILAISASAFTKDVTVSEKVKIAFKKTFSEATDIYWKKINEYYLANFKMDSQNLSAAFDEDGQLVSASRGVYLTELPLTISLALKNQFDNYNLEPVVTEVIGGGETNYYIKAENEKRTVTIKATTYGDLSIVKKARKK